MDYPPTSLNYACQMGDVPRVLDLLAQGVPPGPYSSHFNSNISAALAQVAHTEQALAIADALFEAGSNVNNVDYYGSSPVLDVVKAWHVCDQLRRLRFLLERGARSSIRHSEDFRTAIEHAELHGQYRVLALMREYESPGALLQLFVGMRVASAGAASLQRLAAHRLFDANVFREVHDLLGNTNSEAYNAETMLAAAERGDAWLVKRCIAHGVSTECRDDHGRTPWMLAAMAGGPKHLDVLLVLRQAGARLDAVDNDDLTARDLVAKEIHQHAELMELLT